MRGAGFRNLSLNTEVLNNRTTDVINNHAETIGNNQVIAVTNNQIQTVGVNRITEDAHYLYRYDEYGRLAEKTDR
ncbi:hypothetical protein GIY18_21955, partial [Escherichia coli]|nr:hypothetical protein [Escherichia coli]